MSGHRAFYSLVQYCPDRFRAEAVNVGVILFCPDPHFLGIRITEKHSRLRKLFGVKGRTLDGIKRAERALENRIASDPRAIKSIDDFRAFVSTRANDLQLVEPRLAKVVEAKSDLERLYANLVEPPGRSVDVLQGTVQVALPPVLESVFSRHLRQGKVWKPAPIAVPAVKRDLEVPYAYKNGAVNLVKPTVFGVGKRAESRAATLAVDGDLISRDSLNGEKYKLIVVSAQESAKQSQEITEHIEPLFKLYGVRLIRPEQAADFAREVEQTVQH